MDYRYLVILGVAVLGALLGLAFRLGTIIIAVVVLVGLSFVGIAIGYGVGGESVGLIFGVVSLAIIFLGATMIIAAAVVRVSLKVRGIVAHRIWLSQNTGATSVVMRKTQAAQTPNKSLERTRER
jgi:hypothetical protein